HEHAAYLSDYLSKALVCIDSAGDQPALKQLVKTMIAATSVLISKLQNTPDETSVMQALATVQNDLRTSVETVQVTTVRVQGNTVTHQHIATL
ncbi:hypothetical protein BJ878DRAFT_405972, partial [Calycina marina]